MAKKGSSNRWIHEHLTDEYVKKAQKEGYRSRAVYKLIEIIDKKKIINKGDKVLDLGAAPGGWSQVASKIVGKTGQVIASDILPIEKIPGVDFLQGDFTEISVYETLLSLNEAPISSPLPAKQILKRPRINIEALPRAIFSSLSKIGLPQHVLSESFIEVEALIKYSGYIKRQSDQIAKLKRQERLSIPCDFNYLDITSLSNEAREKLSFVRPQTLGQAMRVSGVSPADVSVLSVFLSTT